MKKSIAAQLGYWSSIALLILGCVYFIFAIFFVFTADDMKSAPTPFVQLASGIATFLTAQVLVMLYSAIHFVNDGNNKIFGSLGISFILLFAALLPR